jgi:hypothetical protein
MDCSSLREATLDVRYGEADAVAARRVAAHQAGCAACREEMAALRRVRRDLPAWTLPATLQPRSRTVRALRSLPIPLGWAAAVLVALGAGFVLSGSELRYRRGELVVHFGGPVAAEAPDVAAQLAAHEARHRAEIAALRAPAPAPDDAALLRSVEALIRQSESRQAGAVDARLAAFAQRTEAQRRYDLARVSAGLSYLEGKTGQDTARTTELMGYVLKASQQR